MILRAALSGLRHFEQFLEQTGIARNILANRLSRLVDHGILERAQSTIDGRRIEYGLTDKGFDLVPALIALRQWGEKWATDAPCIPVIADSRDFMPIREIKLQAHDGRPLTVAELCWVDGDGNRIERPEELREMMLRRSKPDVLEVSDG